MPPKMEERSREAAGRSEQTRCGKGCEAGSPTDHGTRRTVVPPDQVLRGLLKRNPQVSKKLASTEPLLTEDLRLALPGHACVEAGVS